MRSSRRLQELGGVAVNRHEVVAAYSLGVPEVILAHLLRRELAKGDAEAYYQRLQGAKLDAYEGIAAALAELRWRSHLIVVLTGASTRAASTLLAAAGVEVDLLMGGDQVDRPKQDPDGLLRVARRLHVEPADLAYIGDAPVDLRAAKAAGARSVAAGWGHL